MMGDELRLRHKCPSGRPPWEGTGHVVITGGGSEEVSTHGMVRLRTTHRIGAAPRRAADSCCDRSRQSAVAAG